MNLVQVRVDDRLIHGQVVVGCCGPLAVRRLLLAHDATAADAFEAEIYRSAVPPELSAEFLGVEAAAARLRAYEDAGDDVATLVVLADPADLLRLVEAGGRVSAAVLGGLHATAGRRRELLAGFWVGPGDLAALRELLARGVSIQAQSVPGASCVEIRPASLADRP